MLNPSNSLVRGAADAVLREVFGRRYGDLVLGQDTVLITHLIDFANEEHIDDLYRAAGRLQERIGPDSLADYVVAAEAEQAFSQRREEIEALVATGPNDRGLAEKPVYTDAHGRPTEYTPSEDDAYLHDRPSGGYDVCMGSGSSAGSTADGRLNSPSPRRCSAAGSSPTSGCRMTTAA